MIDQWSRLRAVLEVQGRAARVAIVAVRGSSPREVGATLVVGRDLGFRGTIGGGALEWWGLRHADDAMASDRVGIAFHDVVLGPDLGQCCGGRVTLAVEVFEAADLPEVRRLAAREAEGAFATRAAVVDGRLVRTPLAEPDALSGLARDGSLVERFGDDRRSVLLFGAGHVGRALVLALAPLPFRVEWVDGRRDAFPEAVPGNARCHRLDDPVAALGTASGGLVVIATHDHALDFALVDAALRMPDLPWIGVVGSRTKRARFMGKLRESGHTEAEIRRMVMPIGAVGPRSKTPAVIAAAVAVELLVVDEAERRKGVAPAAGAARTAPASSGVGA